MPDLVGGLQDSFTEARDFVRTIERLRSQQTGRKKDVTVNKVRFAYELAYLRAFAAWEAFQEETFLRYLCGYSNSGGQQTLIPPATYSGTLAAAEFKILGGRPFKLWHNPSDVINRSKGFFTLGLHETVLLSVQSRVEAFAAVRHHIAHQRRDTAKKFDAACVTLCGYRLPGSRAGSFLRKPILGVSPAQRWLDVILSELESYAGQIAP